MKDKTFLKLLLDIAMSVLYLMLMFSRRSGAFFHEAVGIGVVALFAAHLLLNRKMTRGLLAPAKRGAPRPKAAPPVGPPALRRHANHNRHGDSDFEGALSHRHARPRRSAPFPAQHKRLCLPLRAGGPRSSACKIPVRRTPEAEKDSGSGDPARALPLQCWRARAGLALFRSVLRAGPPGGRSAHSAPGGRNRGGRAGTAHSGGHGPPHAETEDVPSLEEYLAGQNCNGCSRGCSLLEPDCRRGQARLQQAKETYAGLYGTNETEETEK